MNDVGLVLKKVGVRTENFNNDNWESQASNWEATNRNWEDGGSSGLTTSDVFSRLDLYRDEQISLNQTIQDIRDIEKVFTDFSKRFNLPASKLNNRVFKHYYRTDIVANSADIGTFNANTKVEAFLEINYKTFRKGFIVLNDVKLKNGRPQSYNITFFGETLKLKDQLGDRKLSSLDFTAYNHSYNQSTIKTGLEDFVTSLAGGTTTEPKIIYPLISHTNRFIFNGGDSGVPVNVSGSEKIRNLHYSGEQATETNSQGEVTVEGFTKGLDFLDLKPAIRLAEIIRVINLDPNIDLTFTDDFFRDNATSVFGNAYMWLHRNKGPIGVNSTGGTDNTVVITDISNFSGDEINFFGTAPFDDTAQAPSFDNGRFSFATGRQGQTGEIFTVDWTLTPSNNQANFSLIIRNTSDGQILAQTDHISGNNSTLLSKSFGNINTQNTAEFNIEFVIVTPEPSLNWTQSIIFDRVIYGTDDFEFVDVNNFLITANTVTPNNIVTTIIVSDQIPDISIIAFLTNIFKVFNLTAFIETNPDSPDFENVVVKPLNNFYASGSNRDITSFINTDESTSNWQVPFNDIEFTFSEPKTFSAFYYNRLNNRRYGSIKASDTSDSGRDPRLNRGKDYVVNVQFEKMVFERLIDSSNNSNTRIGYGFFVDDNQNPTIAKPLIFFRKRETGLNSTNGIQFRNLTGNTPFLISSYNRPSNFFYQEGSITFSVGSGATGTPYTFSYADNTGATQTIQLNANSTQVVNNALSGTAQLLSSESPIGISTITDSGESGSLNFSTEIDPFVNGITNRTLFLVYYRKYISDAFSQQRRLLKFNAFLPQSFLMRYTLADTMIISNEAYIINKITTDLQTGRSVLELLNKIPN